MTDTPKRIGLRDQPIENRDEEALGLSEYAEVLTEFVQSCDTPMTIALQGDWGSGKTSLMNLIKNALDEAAGTEERFLTVWFNTWQYAQFNMENTLALSMMSKFADALEAEGQSDTVKKLKRGLWTATRTVAIGAASLVGQADTVKGIADEAERGAGGDSTLDPAASLERIKDGLSEIVEKRIDGSTDRIIVFIDDLDRLVPSRAVELLESLKLFLDIKHCVYVIACDYKVVSAGLKKKFGVAEGELAGRSFFDKIIQVPFKMPTRRYAVDRYVERLLGQMGLDYDSNQDIDLYCRLVEHSVGFNPRSMKRMLNTLQLLTIMDRKRRRTVASTSDSGQPQPRAATRVTFAILCMMERYEAIYDYFLSEELTAERILTLRDGLHSDDDFADLRRKIHGSLSNASDEKDDEQKDVAVNSAAKFVEAFVACVQLDEDENLSDEETKHLAEMMSLSSLVTVGRDVPPPITDRDFVSDMRRTLNSQYKSFVDRYGKFRYEKAMVYHYIGDYEWLYAIQEEDSFAFGFSCSYDPTEQAKRFCDLLWERVGAETPRKWRYDDSYSYHFCEMFHVEAGVPDALATFKEQMFERLDKVTKSRNNIYSIWRMAASES